MWKVPEQNAWAKRNSKQNTWGQLYLDCRGLPEQRFPQKARFDTLMESVLKPHETFASAPWETQDPWGVRVDRSPSRDDVTAISIDVRRCRRTHSHHCLWKLARSMHQFFLQADFLSGPLSSYCCGEGCERVGTNISARAARFGRVCDHLGENSRSV